MRLADRSRAFRLSQPKALIGPVQATRYAGGLDFRFIKETLLIVRMMEKETFHLIRPRFARHLRPAGPAALKGKAKRTHGPRASP